MKQQKVFVSGCFDTFHPGHVHFLKKAAALGDVYVGVAQDENIRRLKQREPIHTAAERLTMVQGCRYVTQAWINEGLGILDWESHILRVKADVLLVNEDGHTPEKEDFCALHGLTCLVMERGTEPGCRPSSSTQLRKSVRATLPYRLDIVGGWLDHPFLNALAPGWVITASLAPTMAYAERSGLATSTRHVARQLWPDGLPQGVPEKLAHILFCCDNPPGKKEISGAQDPLGLCLPGLSRHFYRNAYWPEKIERLEDEATLTWLEQHVFLVPLWPRPPGLNLLADRRITQAGVMALAQASEQGWQAILQRDIEALAQAVLQGFQAQVTMIPAMMNPEIQGVIQKYQGRALGWKLTGAGGGGYLMLLTPNPPAEALPISIRR